MLGRLATGAALVAVVALAGFAGSAGARGGNHGCEEVTRTVYSSHFFASGDNIVVGHVNLTPFRRAERGFPTNQEEKVGMVNRESGGTDTSQQNCGAQEDRFWRVFRSALGPGGDSVRMNGRGPFDSEDDFGPLPRYFRTQVFGEGGADVLRGHSGVDDLDGGDGGDLLKPGGGRDEAKGGAGPDLIRAAGGARDQVRCRAGRDVAFVDERDDAAGCEDLVVR